MSVSSLFRPLGLAVKSVESGVYHLQLQDKHGHVTREMVGLLVSDVPITKKTKVVKLFTQPVDNTMLAARVGAHWQTLDARRFEESGLDPLELPLSVEHILEPALEQRYTRPDGVCIRHAVQLSTGEVVCYN
ncbi:hypothetical protein [Burkholderia ubonensis]|uniref:hypothetical protein n=1 Tax=Burkholderia ubonensis TaxID=101571 RepID=UPI0007524341|nr:hypothetical protein [Burkholderia ubonensis]KVP39694.1 hypothetical protein WJ87_05790 [Burkholderia ubonensis]